MTKPLFRTSVVLLLLSMLIPTFAVDISLKERRDRLKDNLVAFENMDKNNDDKGHSALDFYNVFAAVPEGEMSDEQSDWLETRVNFDAVHNSVLLEKQEFLMLATQDGLLKSLTDEEKKSAHFAEAQKQFKLWQAHQDMIGAKALAAQEEKGTPAQVLIRTRHNAFWYYFYAIQDLFKEQKAKIKEPQAKEDAVNEPKKMEDWKADELKAAMKVLASLPSKKNMMNLLRLAVAAGYIYNTSSVLSNDSMGRLGTALNLAFSTLGAYRFSQFSDADFVSMQKLADFTLKRAAWNVNYQYRRYYGDKTPFTNKHAKDKRDKAEETKNEFYQTKLLDYNGNHLDPKDIPFLNGPNEVNLVVPSHRGEASDHNMLASVDLPYNIQFLNAESFGKMIDKNWPRPYAEFLAGHDELVGVGNVKSRDSSGNELDPVEKVLQTLKEGRSGNIVVNYGQGFSSCIHEINPLTPAFVEKLLKRLQDEGWKVQIIVLSYNNDCEFLHLPNRDKTPGRYSVQVERPISPELVEYMTRQEALHGKTNFVNAVIRGIWHKRTKDLSPELSVEEVAKRVSFMSGGRLDILAR